MDLLPARLSTEVFARPSSLLGRWSDRSVPDVPSSEVVLEMASPASLGEESREEAEEERDEAWRSLEILHPKIPQTFRWMILDDPIDLRWFWYIFIFLEIFCMFKSCSSWGLSSILYNQLPSIPGLVLDSSWARFPLLRIVFTCFHYPFSYIIVHHTSSWSMSAAFNSNTGEAMPQNLTCWNLAKSLRLWQVKHGDFTTTFQAP